MLFQALLAVNLNIWIYLGEGFVLHFIFLNVRMLKRKLSI